MAFKMNKPSMIKGTISHKTAFNRSLDKPPASSTVQATLKSDVFTLDKDGKMLGVMTRSQRRAWEKNNQQLLIDRQRGIDSQTGKSIPKIEDRSYYNRGELLRIGSG